MKKIVLPLLALFLVSVSCNATVGEPSVNAKVDSLSKAFNKLNEEFEILKWGLEKRGISVAQLKAEKEMESKVWDIPFGSSPLAGNPKAPITIVEFSEFQCPYCSRIAPYLDTLLRKYPDKLKLVYKHFPLNFHANAPAAAAASMAAQNQGKFWEFRYALAPFSKELNDTTFIKVAKQIGLNIEKFKKEMVLDAAKQARIDEDIQLGTKIGVQGTPNFFVNGKRQDRFSPDLIEQMIKDLK
jgi:protein-disulfide isomerase